MGGVMKLRLGVGGQLKRMMGGEEDHVQTEWCMLRELVEASRWTLTYGGEESLSPISIHNFLMEWLESSAMVRSWRSKFSLKLSLAIMSAREFALCQTWRKEMESLKSKS
jgi:hypothetical protein